MSRVKNGPEQPDDADQKPGPAGSPELRTSLELVRQATLDLLDSLPGRPERLRLSAAGVSVDVDWRSSAAVSAPGSPVADAAPPMRTATPMIGAGLQPDRPGERAPAEPELDLHYICAPSVGTFYCAPEPGGAPLVVEGATVGLGQSVAIIEAMKLMLPVEADGAGRVVEVLVKDGQAVEFGERIIALAPTGSS